MKEGSGPIISWERFATFVRQVSHDLRNQLNAAELQAALVNELNEDPEVKPEVKRLRELVSEIGGSLQRLSASVATPRPNCMPYAAVELVQDLQEKTQSSFPDAKIKWLVDVGGTEIEVDPQLIEEAVIELFDNAFRHSPSGGELHADARTFDGALLLTLRETKSKPTAHTELWGADPLRNSAHGHYGLGLRRARAIIEAHGGELRAEYDAKTSALVTTLRLPLRAGS